VSGISTSNPHPPNNWFEITLVDYTHYEIPAEYFKKELNCCSITNCYRVV